MISFLRLLPAPLLPVQVGQLTFRAPDNEKYPWPGGALSSAGYHELRMHFKPSNRWVFVHCKLQAVFPSQNYL